MIKANVKQTITFSPVHRPSDEVPSKLMQSDSSTDSPPIGKSVTATQTDKDSIDKISASAKEQLWAPSPNGLYTMTVMWKDSPYDVASFLHKATYRIRISVYIFSNFTLTGASLVCTGAGLELVKKDFIRTARKKSMNKNKPPPLCSANREVVTVERIVPLYIRMGHKQADTWVLRSWECRCQRATWRSSIKVSIREYSLSIEISSSEIFKQWRLYWYRRKSPQ